MGHGRHREKNQRRFFMQGQKCLRLSSMMEGSACVGSSVRVCLRWLRECLNFNCTAAPEFYAVCIVVEYNRSECIYDPECDAEQSTPSSESRAWKFWIENWDRGERLNGHLTCLEIKYADKELLSSLCRDGPPPLFSLFYSRSRSCKG